MATPTGPAKLIFSNGERCDCVFCSPLESDRQTDCGCDARPLTLTMEFAEPAKLELYGALPRERSRLPVA